MKLHFRHAMLVAWILLTQSPIFSQSIQWNHLLLPGEVNVVAKDSSEKTMAIFKSRLFLYDSLQRVSRETGVAFFEYDYIAEFKKPQEVYNLVINFKGASRLMYYIRLFDEAGGEHVVYNYGAIRACDADVETLVLTIAHTPYKVRKVEVGTFVGKDAIARIGLSGEPDSNNILEELVAQRVTSLCNKASYFTEKIALNEGVNSESTEVKPVVAPDGKTLYFHRQNHRDNTGGRKDEQDIYVSRSVNGTWSAAENIGAPLNDNLPNGIASVSSGETTLYLINDYVAPNQQRQGLSYSEKTISGWSFPRKIEVKNFYNRSEYMDFFISPTQNEMILAIQRDDSYGDQDLYVSFYDDATQSWTEPLSLGPEINTMLSEASPFLAADGKTLYFASNGILGYGGFDIFVTHRLDESWTNWSYPENLGPVINTFDDDLYYAVSAAGDQAYFVSTVDRDRNIFRLPLPTIYKPEPVVLLSGKIFNMHTALPEEAEVNVSWHNDTEVIGTGKSDPLTGEYKVVLPAGGIYDYTISKNGFQSVSGTISTLKLKNYEEKQQHIRIREKGVEDEKSLSIPFPGEPTDSTWSDRVSQVIDFMKAFPEYNVVVSGYMSQDLLPGGFKTKNEIARHLISGGIQVERITQDQSDNAPLQLLLQTDSVIYYNEAVTIPEGYARARSQNDDISLLVKGKVIDVLTMRPIAARMLFKLNDKVKSRATSDPATGNYQTLLPANTLYDIVIFSDSTEFKEKLKTPHVEKYEEVVSAIFVNRDKAASVSLPIGSGISQNRDPQSQARWERSLMKKKSSKEIINLRDTAKPIAARIESDLKYLADILSSMTDAKLTLIVHTSSAYEDKSMQESVGKRVMDYLSANGFDSSRFQILYQGASQPRHKKAGHHSNNRVYIQVDFK